MPETTEIEWGHLDSGAAAAAQVIRGKLRITADPRRPAEAAAAIAELISKYLRLDEGPILIEP